MIRIDNDLIHEIRERLVRIETKIDRYDSVELKAFDAHNRVLNLEKEVCELKESLKWAFRAAIGSTFTATLAIVVAIITIRGGK